MKLERQLKPAQVAEILGMAMQTIANWRSAGTGPPWARFGGAVRYDSAKLQKWIEEQERRPRNVDPEPLRQARIAIQGKRTALQPNPRLGRHITQRDRREAAERGEPIT